MNTTTATPCPACLPHRGWAHSDESRRKEPRDVCRSCLGSGVDQATRCHACGHDADEHINGRRECYVCDCGGVSEPTAERPAGHPAWCQPDQCDRRWSPDNMTRHRAKVDVLVYVTAWQADGEPVAAPVVELLPPDEDLTAEDAREVGQALLRAAELIEGARG